MHRVHLPLLPLPVLAAIVAVSACSKARTEEALRIIPPAQTQGRLAAPAEAPAPIPAAIAPAPPAEDPPAPEDLEAFHRSVSK